LLNVLKGRLAKRSWIMGEAYTIADMATFPRVRNLVGFYEAGRLVGITDFQHGIRAFTVFLERPAVATGYRHPKPRIERSSNSGRRVNRKPGNRQTMANHGIRLVRCQCNHSYDDEACRICGRLGPIDSRLLQP
jgi:hypothetical protein